MDLTQINAVLARPDMRAMADEEHSDFHDPRIRAAFLIAPAAVKALTVASLKTIHTPVAIFLGSSDPIAPPATNGELAASLVPGARITELPGVGHYDFLSACGPGRARTLAAYCADGAGVHRAETHAVAVVAAITFFDKALGK
jgi:predicted dienelactone hydrolase